MYCTPAFKTHTICIVWDMYVLRFIKLYLVEHMYRRWVSILVILSINRRHDFD